MDLVRIPGQCAAARNTTDELVFAALLQHWTESHVHGASTKSPYPELESRAVQFAEEKALHFDPLLQKVAGELKRLSGCDLDKLAQQIISHVSARPSLLKSGNSILESIDKALGVGDEVAGAPLPLSVQLAQFAKAMTLGMAKELEAWLLQLVETPGARLGTTRWATKWFTARFEKIHARAKAVVERTEDEIKLIRCAWDTTVNGGGKADTKARQLPLHRGADRLDGVGERHAGRDVLAQVDADHLALARLDLAGDGDVQRSDRKSTRLNSSHT